MKWPRPVTISARTSIHGATLTHKKLNFRFYLLQRHKRDNGCLFYLCLKAKETTNILKEAMATVDDNNKNNNNNDTVALYDFRLLTIG